MPIASPNRVAGGGAIQITDWQEDTWHRQATIGGGTSGATLRTEFPVPDNAVPIDAIIAGWLIEAKTPASNAARALVDASSIKDPATFVFPSVVIALFANDVLSPTADATTIGFVSGSAKVSTLGYVTGVSPDRLDPCGAITSLYNATVGTVASWFQANTTDSLVISLLKGAVNALGSALSAAITAAVDTFLGPALIPIKAAIAAISVAIAFTNAFVPWTANVEPAANPIDYGVDPAPGNPDSFVLTVSGPLMTSWPMAVQSCASLAGVPLPALDPVKTPVLWTPSLGGFAIQTNADIVGTDNELVGTPESPTAVFRFTTNTESQDQAENGEQDSGTVSVMAEVEEDAGKKLQGVLTPIIDGFLSQLPDLVKNIIDNEAVPFLIGLTTPEVPKGRGTLDVQVNFHDAPPPTTTSPPPTAPPTAPPGSVVQQAPAATFSGAWSGNIVAEACSATGAAVQFDAADGNVFAGFITSRDNHATQTAMVAPLPGGANGGLTYLWSAQTDGVVETTSSSGQIELPLDGIVLSEVKHGGGDVILHGTLVCN